MIGVVPLLLLLAPAREMALRPRWERSFPAGIEWCVVLDTAQPPAALVCTRTNQLDLLAFATGRSCWREPPAVQPGTRPAGSGAQTAYCYGPSEVYALSLCGQDAPAGSPTGLRWRVAAAPGGQTDGDPEFMLRLVAAAATSRGVIIVRSDGQVAELDEKTGKPRWQCRLPPSASPTLHVRENTAALVCKWGPTLTVSFFDLRAARPRPIVRELAQPPPIWTTLLDAGLVAVWPRRCGLVSPAGRTWLHELDPRLSPSAATLGVWEADTPALILSDREGSIRACELVSGTPRWRQPARSQRPQELSVVGAHVVALDPDGFAVYRVADGGLLAACSHPRGATPLAAAVYDGHAYGLFRAGAARQADGAHSIELLRAPLAGAGQGEPRCHRLGDAGPVHQVLWVARTLVIVEADRLRAYTLP